MERSELIHAWYTEIKGYKVIDGREAELIKAGLQRAGWVRGSIREIFEIDPPRPGEPALLFNPGCPSLENVFEEIKARNLSLMVERLSNENWLISIARSPTDEEYGSELRGWDPGNISEIVAEALILFVRKFDQPSPRPA